MNKAIKQIVKTNGSSVLVLRYILAKHPSDIYLLQIDGTLILGPGHLLMQHHHVH